MVGRARKALEESGGRGRSGVLSALPTKYSGLAIPALWWRSMVQMRLGLHVSDLPTQCPDCGTANSIDHALQNNCGGAVAKRHNEIRDFLLKLALEARMHVPAGKEPLVGKVQDTDPDTRCDGKVRGLFSPQRDCWIDVLCCDVGANSYLGELTGHTLEAKENEKVRKHDPRVTLAHNADFAPVVCSVLGTMAPRCQHIITLCTERIAGGGAAESRDFSHILHLTRARFQATVWKATSLCLVGRGPGKDVRDNERAAARLDRMAEESFLPWRCVAEDTRTSPA